MLTTQSHCLMLGFRDEPVDASEARRDIGGGAVRIAWPSAPTDKAA
jgi:hypothetical protein